MEEIESEKKSRFTGEVSKSLFELYKDVCKEYGKDGSPETALAALEIAKFLATL